jgi:conjugal transfer mating pair stabilization protein TraG
MGSVEVFTFGGGQYLVNVFNAVAAWCGGGGFRSMLQVIMVIGLGYALMTMAMNLNWRVLYQWFVSTTLMYSVLIVPTTTVIIIDKINPTAGNGSVANVPVGLALIASVTSQANVWLTTTAETMFNIPNGLGLTKYGMVYPLEILEATKQFNITDPNLKANTENYINDCYLMAIMTNPNTTTVTPLQQLVSANVLTGIGPGSTARFTQWYDTANGISSLECDKAYNLLSGYLQTDAKAELTKAALAMYPDITDPTTAYSKLVTDLPAVTTGMYGQSMAATDVFLQRSLTNAFMEARGNLGGAAGDTFSSMRAEVQAQNTMSVTARQALLWVPTLELVLTIVFYAMFPLIFPLMMLPGGGIQVLKGYIGGFFYLLSWGSVSAVLNMFILMKSSAQMATAANNGIGLTMNNLAQLDGMNADASSLAGYLLLSVPVIAGGLAKGAMSLSSSAGGMLAPVAHGAEAASVERTSGNYSYGMVSANQYNTAPSHLDGAGTSTMVNRNGTRTTTTADGSAVYDNSAGISRLGFTPSETQGEMQSLASSAASFHNQANGFRSSAASSYQAATSHANSTIAGSSSHNGFDGGKSSAIETSHRQDGSFGSRSEVGDRLHSDDSVSNRDSKSISDAHSVTKGVRGSVDASIGTPGGGILGSKAGAGVGAFGNIQSENRNMHQKEQTSTSQAGEGHNEGVTTYKSGNDSYAFGDSGVTRNGTFYRYDQLNESRSSLEKSFREAKSYDEQASFSDDKGRRLDKVVSDVQQNGWQMTDDMSQVVASRYNEIANSGKYAGMGAPSLSNVNASAHQTQVRRAIVGDILKVYAIEGAASGAKFRAQIEGGMQSAVPTLAIPTASQMQAARANLGAGPKGPRSGKVRGSAGATPEGTLGQIRSIRDNVANDEDDIRKSQGGIDGAVETHR